MIDIENEPVLPDTALDLRPEILNDTEVFRIKARPALLDIVTFVACPVELWLTLSVPSSVVEITARLSAIRYASGTMTWSEQAGGICLVGLI